MRGVKKNITNPKGSKTSINSKLSEDMVKLLSLRKTKSKTLSPFMIRPTQDMSIDSNLDRFWATSLSLK